MRKKEIKSLLKDIEKEAIFELYFSKSWKIVEKIIKNTMIEHNSRFQRIDFTQPRSRIDGALIQGRIACFRWMLRIFEFIAKDYEEEMNKDRLTKKSQGK